MILECPDQVNDGFPKSNRIGAGGVRRALSILLFIFLFFLNFAKPFRTLEMFADSSLSRPVSSPWVRPRNRGAVEADVPAGVACARGIQQSDRSEAEAHHRDRTLTHVCDRSSCRV